MIILAMISLSLFNFQSQSQPLLTNGGSQEERRPSSRETGREREGTQQSLASLSSPSAPLSSVKSVRNYKRTRPACQVVVQGDSRAAGLSESLPHVYRDTSGSYFR